MAACFRLTEEMERFSPISVALRKKISATPSSPPGPHFPTGRNKALICAGKSYIGPPKCWKCAGLNCKANSPPEPTGVVVVVCPDEPALLGLVSLVAPVILSGNSAVVLPSTTNSLVALTFSEIIATSDLPPGVVNVLAGDRAELAPHFASHMDVNAIVDASADEKIGRELQKGGEMNVKRYVRRELAPAQWRGHEAENPYWVLDTVEMKTAWHPIGL